MIPIALEQPGQLLPLLPLVNSILRVFPCLPEVPLRQAFLFAFIFLRLLQLKKTPLIPAQRGIHCARRVGSYATMTRGNGPKMDSRLSRNDRQEEDMKSCPYAKCGSRVKLKTVPSFTLLSTQISPPCNCTICLTMESPRPVPPISRERALSTR